MALTEDKKIEWLYARFQAVSAGGDRLLFVFGTLFVSVLAVWRSHENRVELPFMNVDVGREVLFGSLVLSAVAAIVAFFGNYDKGEAILEELAKLLGCNYEDLECVDTHPTVIDFMQYRRPTSAARRRWLGRATVALLYPVVLVGALIFLSAVTAYESFVADMGPMDALPLVLSIPLFISAWDRGYEYLRRRWMTFLAGEKARTPSSTAV